MRCELLPRGSVFSMNPIALPTETNRNEHSSEEYNRNFLLHDTPFTMSRTQSKITHKNEEPGKSKRNQNQRLTSK